MSVRTEKVRDELLAIQKASPDGMLHVDHAIAWAAKHRDSALHAELNWDDAVAAQEYRRWQMRRLIQVTVITEDAEPQLVSLTIDRTNGGGYRQIAAVIDDSKLRRIMLRDALVELGRVQKKYDRVKELASVWEEVERVAGREKRRDKRRHKRGEDRATA